MIIYSFEGYKNDICATSGKIDQLAGVKMVEDISEKKRKNYRTHSMLDEFQVNIGLK